MSDTNPPHADGSPAVVDHGSVGEGSTDSSESPLVSVSGLTKYFGTDTGIFDRLFGTQEPPVRAVDGLSFDIRRGETLGLVGESGCGKSTAGETLLRLQAPTSGEVTFDGQSVYDLSGSDLTAFRRSTAIVFQDPFSSLDPRMEIGEIVRQPLDIHEIGEPEERNERVGELLDRVGLSADQFDRYPHEFSGGQRQRIGIARALALDPEFVVLDEPTSALDVSVQAQVLNLLSDLQTEFDLTFLLISHDLSVIRQVCDRVAVMYLGELIEIGPAATVFNEPRHPYTQALLESVPRATSSEADREITTISGDVPSPRNPPSGCRFRTRCPAVIPPPDIDLDQAAYREIQTVRERIANRAFTAENPDASPDEVAATFYDRAIDHDLPDPHRDRLERAFVAVANDEFERATAMLADHYESVCERESPALGSGHHAAACHLLDE